MKKFIILISLFCLTNQFQTKASQNWGLNNQDDGRGKEVAENVSEDTESKIEAEFDNSDDDSEEVDENIRLLEIQVNIEQEKKDQEDQKKVEFENLYSKYPKEVSAVVNTLQNLRYQNSDFANSGFPPEIAKLILGYCESPNYEHYLTLEEHTGLVNEIIKLNNGDIASCSNDKTIKIWHKDSNDCWKCINTLKGHKYGVTSITQLNNGDLVSCCMAEETGVKMWKKDSKKSVYKPIYLPVALTLRPQSINRAIELKNGYLALCTYNGAINVLLSRSRSKILKNFGGGINSIIQMSNGDLVTGSNLLMLWYQDSAGIMSSYQTLDWLTEGSINSIIQLKNGVLASSNNNLVKIWSLDSNMWQCVQILKGHIASIRSIIQLNNGDLATYSADSTIKIWHLNRQKLFECIETLNVDKDSSALQLNNVLPMGNSILELDNGDLVCAIDNKIKMFKKPFNNLFQHKQVHQQKELNSCSHNYELLDSKDRLAMSALFIADHAKLFIFIISVAYLILDYIKING